MQQRVGQGWRWLAKGEVFEFGGKTFEFVRDR